MARKPKYTYVSPVQIAIFIPVAKAVPTVENLDETLYCEAVELLPI